MKLVSSTARMILAEKNYRVLILLTASFFFVVFVFIPLVTVPGNDLMFQLQIFSARDYFLMALLSALAGLNVAFLVYALKQSKAQSAQAVAGSAISGASGVFGAIVGTASCASCLASLFGLVGLGTGGVFFVLKNQAYFLLGAIALMLISLYFSARKVNKICISCQK